ncbi:hypothetical protein BXZ70DRAFT_891199, partial [Cristinia sonorae]
MARSIIRLTLLLAASALLFAPIRGAPAASDSSDFKKQNGLDAQKQNAQFATLKASDPCAEGTQACVEQAFAQCVGGKWALTKCSGGTVCTALPLVNKPGTSITCDTQADADARIQAAGVDVSSSGNDSTGNSVAPASVTPPAAASAPTAEAPASTASAPAASATSSADSGDDSGDEDCSD